MRWIVVVAAMGLLAGCGIGEDPTIAEAKDAVKASLRDPDSAQFQNLRPCEKPPGVEGEVNAKNGYGGYSGFRQFYYVNSSVVFIDDEGATDAQRKCWSDRTYREVIAERDELLGGVTNSM